MPKKEFAEDVNTTAGVIEELKTKEGYNKLPNSYFKVERIKSNPQEITYKLKIKRERIEQIVEDVENELTKLKALLVNPDLQ
ncbi:MAG: hypothetical protein KAI72_09380 [Candidatus Pacebacteria bacterium]|nr:hypothetical protein [Candidatus Paceibacterota bacterium]